MFDEWQKTTNEIVIETVNYYEPHPERRAFDASTCLYLTDDGRRCAVGRVLAKPLPEFASGVTNMNNADALEACLRDEYRGHPLTFWTALQDWHDSCEHWDPACSDGGNPEKQRVDHLLLLWNDYCEGPMPTFQPGRGFVDYPITEDAHEPA